MILVGLVGVRLLVSLLSSSAVASPARVTIMAVIFRWGGIVITWMLVVGILWEIMNPAMMLP